MREIVSEEILLDDVLVLSAHARELEYGAVLEVGHALGELKVKVSYFVGFQATYRQLL